MKKNILAVPVAVSLLLALFLGACGTGNVQQTGPQTHQTDPPVQTQPPFTLDSIRTAELSDVPAHSLYYDTACYMLYYDIMDAPEDKFDPYGMMTRVDGADAMCRLTGKTMQQALPRQGDPLTRAELCVMLYEAAKYLNLSTEVKGTNAVYTDVDLANADQELTETTWKAAALWATEKGLLRSFVGRQLLPNVAVSRLQLAQAIIGLKALDPEDTLAPEIYQTLPVRSTQSAAEENRDAIQAAIDAAAQKYGAAGLQVAVIENGTVTGTYAYGWATKGSDPMTPDHKIRIASISKVAVGITAQLLREEGIVDLDGDISQYWDCEVKNPKYPTMPITIRGMLTHTSSIINAGDSTSRAYESVRSKLQKGGYSSGVPGDIGYWAYNNYAFAVLGMTLELAAQRTVDDILQEKLYVPMDIDAAFGPGDIKNTDLLATIYRGNGEVGRSVAAAKQLHSTTTPGGNGVYFAGGMTTSVSDLGKLIALLANDGTYEGVQLLDPGSVVEMETYMEPQVPDGSYQAHPMRYWPDLYGRKGIYFHTGSAYGVFNAATYDPETRDGVVVLTTGASGAKDDYGIYKVCAEINQQIYSIIE